MSSGADLSTGRTANNDLASSRYLAQKASHDGLVGWVRLISEIRDGHAELRGSSFAQWPGSAVTERACEVIIRESNVGAMLVSRAIGKKSARPLSPLEQPVPLVQTVQRDE